MSSNLGNARFAIALSICGALLGCGGDSSSVESRTRTDGLCDASEQLSNELAATLSDVGDGAAVRVNASLGAFIEALASDQGSQAIDIAKSLRQRIDVRSSIDAQSEAALHQLIESLEATCSSYQAALAAISADPGGPCLRASIVALLDAQLLTETRADAADATEVRLRVSLELLSIQASEAGDESRDEGGRAAFSALAGSSRRLQAVRLGSSLVPERNEQQLAREFESDVAIACPLVRFDGSIKRIATAALD